MLRIEMYEQFFVKRMTRYGMNFSLKKHDGTVLIWWFNKWYAVPQLKQRHPLIIYGIVTIKKAVNEESSSREQQQLRYFLNYLMKHIIFPTEWLNLVIGYNMFDFIFLLFSFRFYSKWKWGLINATSQGNWKTKQKQQKQTFMDWRRPADIGVVTPVLSQKYVLFWRGTYMFHEKRNILFPITGKKVLKSWTFPRPCLGI